MRSSKAQAAEHRERIIAEAARLFRERGFGGIGVAEVMKNAGLTHGGFYGHFASKEDLMAQACQRAVSDMLAEWTRLAERAPADPLHAIAVPYLSKKHRDQAGTGCLMVALGSEVSRQAGPVRHTVTECFALVLDAMTRLVPGGSKKARRKTAIATFASMAGALLIARALDDPKVSDEVLKTVSATILAQDRKT